MTPLASNSRVGTALGLAALVALAAIGVERSALAAPAAPVRIDLTDAELPRIEQVETSYLPFKEKASYSRLLEGWRSRWWEPVFFSDMLWATSVRARVEVTVFAPSDRTLSLHMAPYEGGNAKLPAQKVDVLWNGVRLGECAFVKEEGWALKEFKFRVPAAAQIKGKNVVTFLSRYCVAPLELEPEKYANKPKEGRDPSAFGLDSLRLSGPGEATGASAEVDAQPDFAKSAGSFAGGAISQAVNTRIIVPVKLPAASHCTFSLAGASASAEGDVHGSVTLRWDTLGGPQERILATYPAANGAKAEPVDVGTADAGGAAAEVIFEVVAAQGSAPDTSLLWKGPVLEVESAPGAEETPAAAPRETPHAENVLFILLDACRADSMGCYGYGRDTTPFIDTLAKSGVVYERAYSAAPYTYSSTWSLYTSLFPFQHGAPMVPRRPSDSLPMLQKTLRGAGIVTGFSCGNPWSFDTGMANRFDEFLPAFEHIFTKTPPVRTPGGVTHRSIDFMFRHRNERFFMYAHYMIPHEPYLPPAPFLNRFTVDVAKTLPATAEAMWPVNFGDRNITHEELGQLKARYDENLLSVDAEVAELCQALKTLGLAEKTMVVITADHGESFMEHGVLSHNLTVYEEVMRIPMVFSGPMFKSRAGERPSGIVRNVDYYPTICAAMGVGAPEGLEGRNVLTNGGGDSGIAAFGQATYDRHPLEAYWWARYKLIRDDYSASIEVYDLTTDPKETSNLALRLPVLADYLVANARQWKERGIQRSAAPNEDVVISPEISKQLQSAGYLGY